MATQEIRLDFNEEIYVPNNIPQNVSLPCLRVFKLRSVAQMNLAALYTYCRALGINLCDCGAPAATIDSRIDKPSRLMMGLSHLQPQALPLRHNRKLGSYVNFIRHWPLLHDMHAGLCYVLSWSQAFNLSPIALSVHYPGLDGEIL